MSKSKINTKYDPKRAILVKKLAIEFECSPDYIRKSISKQATGENAEAILREYRQRYRQLEAVLS